MRTAAAFVLFLLGMVCFAQSPRADNMMLMGVGNQTNSSGSSYNAATTAWIAAVVGAGGTVSATQSGYVNTLTGCLQTNSVWTAVIDRMWLFGSENATQASIDIVNLAVATAHGSLTFTAGSGYAGDGSTAYLSTTYAPSTAGGNMTLNSSFVLNYVTNVRATTTGAGYESGGYDSGGNHNVGLELFNSGNGSNELGNYGLNDGGTSYNLNITKTNALWIATRTGATATALYQNGSSLGTGSNASTALLTQAVYIMARNGNGAATSFTVDSDAVVAFGGGVTSGQASAISTCVNAYATSVGFNQY